MIRYRIEYLSHFLRFIDATVVVLSYTAIYILTSSLVSSFDIAQPTFVLRDHVWFLSVASVMFLVTLNHFHSYKEFIEKPNFHVTGILKPCLIGSLLITTLLFFFDSNQSNVLFTSIFCLTTTALLLTERKFFNFLLISRYNSGHFCRNVLVIGTGSQARNYADQVRSHPEWGVKVFGYIEELAAATDYQSIQGETVGKVSDLPFILKHYVVDEVVVALESHHLFSLDFIVKTCKEIGVDVTIASMSCGTDATKVCYSECHNMPLMMLSMSPFNKSQLIIKSIFDMLVSFFIIALSSPLLFLVAILIKLNTNGPILYAQTRCGLNGRRFKMYKFRSMYVDSDKRLNELLIHNECHGPVFKMKNDPRVTGVGYWLRKMSIDELPQLINVLQGHMSLIGPRPPLPHEVSSYDMSQRRRLSMVPGITGLWQVSGRSDLDFEKWVELDLYYIDHWSLWLDLKILFKTIPVVVLGKGAY